MEIEDSVFQILRTKLHRPSVPRDYLHRPRLIERLSQNIDRSLTVVSAPAGYGKSTLLSSWVNGYGILNAWLSLDESDNDTAQFLTYFIAAVGTIFPRAMAKSSALLDTAATPQIPMVADRLVADLDQIGEPFVLVLDDYHLIHNDDIHKLLTALIKAPGGSMHLAVASRKDPPIPLAAYRGKGWVTEIRANDLRFSTAEAAAFVEKCVGRPVKESALAALGNKTEGWVTALRLAALTVRNSPDLEHTVSVLPEDNKYVTDYIVHEIISKQPPKIQEFLIRTSLLERFCAPLCDALCIPGKERDVCEIGGSAFIHWLIEVNLFIIPLDAHNRWFRYHHLFQQLLRRQLRNKLTEREIGEIHQRAGDWFMEQELMDEALHHRLEQGDTTGAGRLVADSRHEMMNQERWHRLNQWMHKLPRAVVENDIDLLLTKGWLYENRLRYAELVGVVERIDSLTGAMGQESEEESQTLGEYHALKAAACYLSGDGPSTVTHARKGIDRIPDNHSSELAFALIVLAFGRQMEGDGIQGRELLTRALSQAGRHVRTYHARLLFGLCFLDWLEADMHGIRQTAEQVILFGRDHDLLESLSFGHYFMGLALYHLDELPAAEPHLQQAVKKGKLTNINTFAHASYLLALVHQAMGKPETAREIAKAVTAFALANHNIVMLQDAKAFQAELALRQGRLPAAAHWAKTYDPFPLNPVLRFYTPPLTLLKICIAQGSPASRDQAMALCRRLNEYYSATHNNRILVEILVLEALLHQNMHQFQKARAPLQQAVRLCRAGGNRRSFIDLGKPMADLLVQIYPAGEKDPFIASIFEAVRENANFKESPFQPNDHPGRSEPAWMKTPLSAREMEVLHLLSKHLRDKEIAAKLHISPATVRRHCTNIYRKLDVNSRSKAVERALALGLV
jgi:LuxR family maltose regulon positive regulatory protein